MGNIMHQYGTSRSTPFRLNENVPFLSVNRLYFWSFMRRVKHFHSTIFHSFWELYSFLQNDLIMCSLGLGESNLEE